MTTLKKPVKPTKEIIDKAVARRKTVLRTERKALRSGTLAQINEQLTKFASDNRVSTEAVRFTFTYYGGASMTCRRQETQDEKYARTKDDYEYKYRQAKRTYEYEQARIERERQQAEATLRRLNTPVVNKTVVCCQCACRCKS